MTRTFVLLCAMLPAVAVAQLAEPPGFVRPQIESAGDAADRLAGYLRTLAVLPRDVDALTGAGRAALDVGDANAAIGFYARAQELSPRNGRIKAGLGAALLRMGKAREALRLFNQAVELAVPEAEIAADRGLAWDLRGEPKRAQRDYRVALAGGEDAETTRRLALSTAISGDQAGAVQLLTPLLYRNDAAAWRARAFALALTGDTAGAGAIASAMMLPGQAVAMQPFLVRLAGLAAADKARAVHFGEMPSDGTAYSAAELAGFGASTAERSYRPEVAAAAPRTPAANRRAPVAPPSPAWLRSRTALLREPPPSARTPEPAPRPTELATAAKPKTVADEAPLMLTLNLGAPAKAAVPASSAKPTEDRPAAKKPVDDPAKRRADAKPKEARDVKEKAEREAKADPERIWVQVAGGANRSDLPKAWTAAKAKAGPALAKRSASVAKVGATNRLLVGPFKSKAEAQALVNRLGGAFIVSTDKGERVEKLAVE